MNEHEPLFRVLGQDPQSSVLATQHKPWMANIYTEQVFQLQNPNFVGITELQKEARDLV